MSQDLAVRLRTIYSGEAGDAWARIERESPATYWEENHVLGRRDLSDLLVARLQPLAGRRILDAGCGRGLLAGLLARAGAHVTAVDLLTHHVLEARGRSDAQGPTFAVADFRDLLGAPGAFDEIILQEVLEDYEADERVETIRQIAGSGAERIHLIFRQPGRWGGLIAPMLPATVVPTLDPVPLLRLVHRHSPYRLACQESVRRRSYNVKWVEFTLEPGFVRSNTY